MKTRIVKLALILLIIFPRLNFSQSLDIDLSNPLPRVGQEFEIDVDLNFIVDYIIENLDSSFLVNNTKFNNLKIKLTAKDTGSYSIGPFVFEFNDTLFETNKLHLNINNAIDTIEGLWIKKFKHNSYEFIILEQVKKTKWKNIGTKKIPQYHTNLENEKAYLVDDTVNDIQFEVSYSRNIPIIKNEKDYLKDMLYYTRDVYFVTKPDNIPLTLNKSCIKNKPNYVIIDESLK